MIKTIGISLTPNILEFFKSLELKPKHETETHNNYIVFFTKSRNWFAMNSCVETCAIYITNPDTFKYIVNLSLMGTEFTEDRLRALAEM